MEDIPLGALATTIQLATPVLELDLNLTVDEALRKFLQKTIHLLPKRVCHIVVLQAATEEEPHVEISGHGLQALGGPAEAIDNPTDVIGAFSVLDLLKAVYHPLTLANGRSSVTLAEILLTPAAPFLPLRVLWLHHAKDPREYIQATFLTLDGHQIGNVDITPDQWKSADDHEQVLADEWETLKEMPSFQQAQERVKYRSPRDAHRFLEILQPFVCFVRADETVTRVASILAERYLPIVVVLHEYENDVYGVCRPVDILRASAKSPIPNEHIWNCSHRAIGSSRAERFVWALTFLSVEAEAWLGVRDRDGPPSSFLVHDMDVIRGIIMAADVYRGMTPWMLIPQPDVKEWLSVLKSITKNLPEIPQPNLGRLRLHGILATIPPGERQVHDSRRWHTQTHENAHGGSTNNDPENSDATSASGEWDMIPSLELDSATESISESTTDSTSLISMSGYESEESDVSSEPERPENPVRRFFQVVLERLQALQIRPTKDDVVACAIFVALLGAAYLARGRTQGTNGRCTRIGLQRLMREFLNKDFVVQVWARAWMELHIISFKLLSGGQVLHRSQRAVARDMSSMAIHRPTRLPTPIQTVVTVNQAFTRVPLIVSRELYRLFFMEYTGPATLSISRHSREIAECVTAGLNFVAQCIVPPTPNSIFGRLCNFVARVGFTQQVFADMSSGVSHAKHDALPTADLAMKFLPVMAPSLQLVSMTEVEKSMLTIGAGIFVLMTIHSASKAVKRAHGREFLPPSPFVGTSRCQGAMYSFPQPQPLVELSFHRWLGMSGKPRIHPFLVEAPERLTFQIRIPIDPHVEACPQTSIEVQVTTDGYRELLEHIRQHLCPHQEFMRLPMIDSDQVNLENVPSVYFPVYTSISGDDALLDLSDFFKVAQLAASDDLNTVSLRLRRLSTGHLPTRGKLPVTGMRVVRYAPFTQLAHRQQLHEAPHTPYRILQEKASFAGHGFAGLRGLFQGFHTCA